ncbi:hypothetical protein LSTR_LSTR013448 [Laodelphax striatellus]|uniref:Uncharacterized protein n=1 Tax=Laodelphax striatellus TaxID=195883 RepID=A0A482WV09_LAOST|nr:hypothetical protein LSTR_LSTR013448 [Laodelphax striatellus]
MAKLKDVERLLKIHYGDKWTENEKLSFYRKALTMQRIRAEDGDSGMNEEQELLCEPMEESTELRV